MHLFSTMAAAAVVSSAVATNVAGGSNYTFSAHSSVSATSLQPQTLTKMTLTTGTAASTTAASTSAAASSTSQGTLIGATKVEALLKLSQSFKFEVRGGLCAISNMPAEAAVVSWRLVYDIDLKSTFRFEICEPRDQGRVVTKVQGQYVYGLAVSHNVTASGVVELVCDNGEFNHVKIENKKVVETKAVSVETVQRKVYECSDVAKCTQSTCKGDKCGYNLVAKVGGAVYTNTTAPAHHAGSSPGSSVTYKFEECKVKTECSCVQTCVEAECKVEKPTKGPAPAAVPADKVKTIPAAGPAKGEKPEAPHTPNQPAAAPPKAAADKPAGGASGGASGGAAGGNGTAVPGRSGSAVTGGSGRVVIAFNVLAGVVAMALFL
ncbi:hypothetical protein HRG_007717 [Hirsutella rhossiliensis]|uniref:Uncharacterized protein n=1 Tax=Hirsutella rhossiliensis TaxID=111463 RepID=A0A9P8SH04_9HYPO|nr:uncharacterized protein HRG_07717 [Hirsutella rhossiliensis]KAH0961639.1 hypothetical protein HRG_07717 [Hirsutella rhossiliensis]